MKQAVKTITFEQGQKLLWYIRQDHHSIETEKLAIRNKLMVLIMLDAGLRVGELVQLRLRDLYFGDGPVKNLIVRADIAKLGFERVIPTSNGLLHAIEEIWKNQWQYLRQDFNHFAFWGALSNFNLTVRQIQFIVEKASVNAIGFKITPHVLRHTFATRLMRITTMPVVQKLLGHCCLSSTQIYMHPNTTDLTRAIAGIDNAKSQEAKTSLENAEKTVADSVA